MEIEIKGYVVLVDEEDRDRIAGIAWHPLRSGRQLYFKHTDSDRKSLLLHRFIINIFDRNLFVDHVNGNTLDNRKSNLRLCTKAQNGMNRGKNKNNTSGYKGVSFDKRSNKWVAFIMANGKHLSLGSHDTPEKAYEAYCKSAKELHGDFVRTE